MHNTKTCPVCNFTTTPAVMARHKGSPTCKRYAQMNQARADLLLSFSDAEIFEDARVVVKGKRIATRAVGLDTMIGALTVVHQDGAVRQYLASEWTPMYADRTGWTDGRGKLGIR